MIVSYILSIFTFLSLYYSYRPTIGTPSWILSLFGTCFYGPLIVLHVFFLLWIQNPILILSLLGLLIHLGFIFYTYKDKEPISYFQLFFSIPEFWTQPSEKIKLPTGEAYLFKTPRAEAPCVIMVFGGGFIAGNPAQIVHLFKALQKQGFHVIALPYQTLPSGKWPQAIEDLIKGARYVLDLNRPDFSPKEFHLAGRSAGGFLALLLSHYLKVENKIKSVTALYPICDLKEWSKDSSSIRVLGSNKIVSQLLENHNGVGTDLRLLDQNLNRNLWIVTGDFDQHVSPHHSEWIFKALKNQGCQVQLSVYPLQNHGFDVNRYSVAGQIFFKDWLKKLLATTDHFLT